MVMKVSCIKEFEYIINYCENNLCHEMSLEELAAKAGYSMFHFCRLFQLVTGYTPMEYFSKRRLSQAAMELYNTNEYIRDIGYKWGFNSHENFVRAFRKQFGVSPSQYRECRSSLNLFHRIESIENSCINDINLAPEFIGKPSFMLAGFMCPIWKDGTNKIDIPKHWNTYHADRLYGRIDVRPDHTSRLDIGITISCNDYNTNCFSYIIGIEVDDFKGINQGCTKMIVPAARYAVFRTPPASTHTFVRNIHMTWDYIYKVWFPQTGFRHTGTYEFETYCEKSRTFTEEIWIPIEERKV